MLSVKSQTPLAILTKRHSKKKRLIYERQLNISENGIPKHVKRTAHHNQIAILPKRQESFT
jgi:hypothetical protein